MSAAPQIPYMSRKEWDIVLAAVELRSIPAASVLREAHGVMNASGNRCYVVFDAIAAFHLQLSMEPKNRALLEKALWFINDRPIAVTFVERRDEFTIPASEQERLPRTERTYWKELTAGSGLGT